jgi:transcriptional regulator with XRE-family HTH domain
MHLIRLYREKLGWSVRTLSINSKMSPRLLWEIDNTPEYDFKKSTMKRLCDTFNLPPSILFFEDKESEKRMMLSAILRLCIDLTGLTEQEFLRILAQTTVEGGESAVKTPKLPENVLLAIRGALAQDDQQSQHRSGAPQSPAKGPRKKKSDT